jgi:hypothetical protein
MRLEGRGRETALPEKWTVREKFAGWPHLSGIPGVQGEAGWINIRAIKIPGVNTNKESAVVPYPALP